MRRCCRKGNAWQPTETHAGNKRGRTGFENSVQPLIYEGLQLYSEVIWPTTEPGRQSRFDAIHVRGAFALTIDDAATPTRVHDRGAAFPVHGVDVPTIAAAGFLPVAAGDVVPPAIDDAATHGRVPADDVGYLVDSGGRFAAANGAVPPAAGCGAPANDVPAPSVPDASVPAGPVRRHVGSLGVPGDPGYPGDGGGDPLAKQLRPDKRCRRIATTRLKRSRRFFSMYCSSQFIPPTVVFLLAGLPTPEALFIIIF